MMAMWPIRLPTPVVKETGTRTSGIPEATPRPSAAIMSRQGGMQPQPRDQQQQGQHGSGDTGHQVEIVRAGDSGVHRAIIPYG